MNISNNAQALIFASRLDTGTKAQVTVVVATQKEVKVVLNKVLEIQTVDLSKNVTALEYNPNGTTTLRTFTVKDGVLCVK